MIAAALALALLAGAAPAQAAGPEPAALLAEARAALRAARRAEAAAEARLGRAETAQALTLAALDRLGRAPPLAFFAHPAGPTGAARAAMALAPAAPALQAEAARLRRALAALAAAAAQTRRGADRLAQAERVARAADAPAPTPPPAPDARLDAALAALGAGPAGARDAPPPPPWPLPARGAVDASRPDRLAVAAPAFAPVTAPWAASVRHIGRGPRGGGTAVVLEPASGVLVAVEGLGPVAAALGDTLRPGATFAAAPGPAVGPDAGGGAEFLIELTAQAVPPPPQTLYIHVWIDGAPANPADWFATNGERTTN